MSGALIFFEKKTRQRFSRYAPGFPGSGPSIFTMRKTCSTMPREI